MTRTILTAALALAATGCEHILGLPDPSYETDASTVPRCAEGVFTTTRQAVIDSFRAPTSSAEADASAFDLDGDGTNDNVISQVLSSLATFEPEFFALQPTIDHNLASGALLQLVQADLGDGCALSSIYQGEDRDIPVNPADNFSGQESFRVVGGARGHMSGGRAGDTVTAGDDGTAELRLPLFRGSAPIELPLVAARIRYTVNADGLIEGAIGGAIRADVVEGVVIPSLAASVQEIVTRECSGTAPQCCPLDSSGETALALFDTDGDCAIAIEEVRGTSVIMALFRPDIDLYNGAVLEPRVDGVKDAISIGIAFTAVNAFFLTGGT